ncbi:NAD(P)-binding domain-containing protein [Corallococcus exercitus]|uniref:NAD(P)-binding domain-containing protein n=1 Tax=Corallococcus exercitus TaxID=2316736 RepID=A0A7Y4NT68_9BACT|nr:NAD(P)-binding domain-containing protein [Corallococcus exercitus]NOK34973.1 NAD(P)-binding domain-containing protein [Corallococcus exercitus]
MRRDPDGGCLLELVNSGGVHPIHAIHERLRGVLERLPDGLELAYLCRVAPGRHYNVSHLIAVEICERQQRLASVTALLPEAFIAERPWLLLARARARLTAGEVARGVEDARQAFQRGVEAADAPGVAEFFAWLPPEGREALRPEYLAWFERQPAEQLARWQIELRWWSERQLLEHGTALAPQRSWGSREEASRVVAELHRRGSGSAARLEARLGATAAPQGMDAGSVAVPRTDRPLRIGIIGGGRIGVRLGTLWARAGHDVRIGVRRPWQVSAEPPVAVGDVSRALAHGEVIVLATPVSALKDVAEAARQALSGVVVIDVTNPEDPYYAARLGNSQRGSGSLTGALFPGARTVKAFNTLHERALFGPTVALVPPSVPIASDDPEAAATAAQLARDAGFEPVVVGPLSASARFDRGTALWGSLASHAQVCAVLGIEAPARPSHEQLPTRTLVEAVLSLAIPKEVIEPDSGEDFYPFGDAWRRQYAEWRLPCPDGLAELADGAGEVLIDIGGWGLYEPQADTDLREGLRRDVSTAHLTEMVAPLFGRDGDLLLLDAEGRVHLWLHEEGDETRVVARDFRALLAIFAARIDPGLL